MGQFIGEQALPGGALALLVVGQLVRRSGGTVGGARSGGASGRAFTEGGTGLGRNRPGFNGMDGMPGTHGSQKKDKKGGKRPDYLVEDEETWRTDDAVNPPVIE